MQALPSPFWPRAEVCLPVWAIRQCGSKSRNCGSPRSLRARSLRPVILRA